MRDATPEQMQAAIADLKINVPIYKTEQKPDGTLVFYLYGGQVLTHPAPSNPTPTDRPDALSTVHGIGARGEEKLKDIGIINYRGLANAYREDLPGLAAIFNTPTLDKIGAWLKANKYI